MAPRFRLVGGGGCCRCVPTRRQPGDPTRALEGRAPTKRFLAMPAMAAPFLLAVLTAAGTAQAQKEGGILRVSHFDSPASMSLHEESTTAALRPAMGVFNNLVVYDQHVAQNGMESKIGRAHV